MLDVGLFILGLSEDKQESPSLAQCATAAAQAARDDVSCFLVKLRHYRLSTSQLDKISQAREGTVCAMSSRNTRQCAWQRSGHWFPTGASP